VTRFDGKHIVVTGGARGIGRAIVEAFLDEGASVVALDVLSDELDRMRSEQQDPARVETIAVDLSDAGAARSAASEAIQRSGRVDVLVNCAGVMTSGPILEMPLETFDRTIAVNTRGPLITMQTIGGHMADQGGGAIVNVASANAFKNESPEAAYNASKAALVALTKAMAHELGHRNIRANCVAPGQTITKEKGARTETDPEQARIQREYVRRIPMRRAGRPSEQAAAVLFLASDDASFVNGETLIVDGGELGGGEWYDHALEPPIPTAISED
jgi:3-oxoacyl-[acyl-carrier protein] reductase